VPQSQSQSQLPFETLPAGADVDLAAHVLASRALPAEPGVWDELRDASGALRANWQRFAQALPSGALAEAGVAAGLDLSVAQVAQRIAQDGVTHNVFADGAVAGQSGSNTARPWSLELLPLLIDAADWAAIEAGVTQRAQLAELMLADLYGPQALLQEGLVPPALLFRHPGWLRAMCGVVPPAGQRLSIIAFDLARGPDGRWCHIAQRTQSPSGLGYVLHNRLLVAQQFPQAFQDLRVQRIASSYRCLLDTLERNAAVVAQRSGDAGPPRVVLLTPGPYSETYFEHAYLARYLGVPLVEGGDLVVRDQRLHLKTVEGLDPVHGVLRRLDDDWCDPLELRPNSALGVPGLLQAVRAGTVVMSNALGSGFLEAPALQGFLPAVARRLMQQDLLLPSLPTWWCGEDAAWQTVLASPQGLSDKLLRNTFPGDGRASQMRQQREPGHAFVDEDRDAWTVQGKLRFSHAPLWQAGSVMPRPAMVRVYAIAGHDGHDVIWQVMPGGMTRVARREDASVSMQRGGTSLDTWVLMDRPTDGPVDNFGVLPQRLQVAEIAQRHRPVSSRMGENLFWLGRYTERTEQLLRLARATLVMLGAGDETPAAVQQAVSTLAVKMGLAPVGVPTLVQSAKLFERAVLAGLGKTELMQGGTSIAFNLQALERASMALRERLSPEHWGLIRSMRDGFQRALTTPAGELPSVAQVLPALDRLALQLAAVTGAQADRMTRDHGWRLLTVGRLIERLIGVATQLQAFVDAQAVVGPRSSALGVDLLLELFDSLITFRARYQRHEDLLALTDLLVLDSANPRAIACVLRRLRTEVSKLPGDAVGLASLLGLLPHEGTGLSWQDLQASDDSAIAEQLHALCTSLASRAALMADGIGDRYFTLAAGMDRAI
jgi:uncharacterized circularly permuted ATP-grasp superfamily protein/uncharacterized alpha-E superfamily protein